MSGPVRPVLAGVLDAALVVVFAAVGRRSHAEGLTTAGVAQTAWPFLAGAAAGWVLALATMGTRTTSQAFGAVVVAGAVVGGMLLRVVVTGDGTAVSFIVVATAVLAVFLLGWRLAARFVG